MLGLILAGAVGVRSFALSLVSKKMKFILYVVRSFTAKSSDLDPDAFCGCVSSMENCDYFLIHKTDYLQCNFMKRYCCKTEALEQMLHRRVSGAPYVPKEGMNPKPYDYIYVPQIKTQAANDAREECECQFAFWSCEVTISKPWRLFDSSYKCPFLKVYCCKISFLKDLLVPTLMKYNGMTDLEIDDDDGRNAEFAGLHAVR